MTRHHDLLVAAAVGLALCLAARADAAEPRKPKEAGAATTAPAMKHRHSAIAARPRDRSGVPAGPLYNGQDYLGDDPDPNIRSYLIRDMNRYGGND
jgi:hypothetical protein